MLNANRQQHKIRLAGIDAPELKQAFGIYRSKMRAVLKRNFQVMPGSHGLRVIPLEQTTPGQRSQETNAYLGL